MFQVDIYRMGVSLLYRPDKKKSLFFRETVISQIKDIKDKPKVLICLGMLETISRITTYNPLSKLLKKSYYNNLINIIDIMEN